MQALEPDDPRSIGRCRILARVGAGGMAIVYFGRSAGGRALAVKVMHAEFAGDPEFRERFRHEVDAARAAGGGYSAAVVDADPAAERPWLATEYLPSVSLRDAVRDHGPLPADALWPLAAGVAEALFSIHRAGIAHLDLKPANVLLTADGPRLIDFGIAHPISGTDVGPASDVFSFGATLAFAGTGSSHSADSIADDVLRSMVARCLNPDPAARPTVPELIGYLISARTGAHTSDDPWLPPELLAEVDRRAYEADNPPLPLPVDPADEMTNRRRMLLIGAGVGALVLGGGGGLTALALWLRAKATPLPPNLGRPSARR